MVPFLNNVIQILPPSGLRPLSERGVFVLYVSDGMGTLIFGGRAGALHSAVRVWGRSGYLYAVRTRRLPYPGRAAVPAMRRGAVFLWGWGRRGRASAAEGGQQEEASGRPTASARSRERWVGPRGRLARRTDLGRGSHSAGVGCGGCIYVRGTPRMRARARARGVGEGTFECQAPSAPV